MSKFKVGDKVKVYFHDHKFDGEIFGVAEYGGLYNERYAVSYIDMDGDLVNDMLSGENLEKKPNNKFKQGDILICYASMKEEKFIVLKYYKSQLSDKVYYVLLNFKNEQHNISQYDKQIVENDYEKVGEV